MTGTRMVVAVESHTKKEEVLNYTSPTFGRDVLSQAVPYIERLDNLLSELISSRLTLDNNGQIHKLTAADIRQFLFASTRARGGVEICIRNMLLENAMTLENRSGFSSLIATTYAIKTLKSHIGKLRATTNHTIDISSDIEELSMMSRRASKDIAFKSIKEYCRDPLSSSIILQACSMTGHSGQVYIDSTPANENSIELTNGYTFKFGLEPNFCASSKTTEWKEYSPKVLLIDGIIETVGEINRVLEYCHEEKSACVIFARGFSQEVLGTLAVNKARDTLNVVPVMVPFDLEGINSLVDLAKICNCDIVSSLKGDAISSIEPSELKSIEYFNGNDTQIVLLNDLTKNAVKRHMSNISSKKDTESIPDKINLLNKRLRSLSSVCTNIRISDTGLDEKNIKLRIQHGINMLKHICVHGYVNLPACLESLTTKSVKDLISMYVQEGYTNTSAYELILGLTCGESLTNNILSSRVYLLLDDNKDG